MSDEGVLTQMGPEFTYFKGKVLLIVNVASQCGFTVQYKGLQALYERYRTKGFEILGVPCNDFGSQEPSDYQEILKFCHTKYNVTFPLFKKVKILGNELHPLYRELLVKRLPVETSSGLKSFLFKTMKPIIYKIKGMPNSLPNGIEWNFHKILVNRKAEPMAHFSSDVEPADPRLIRRIELELGIWE